MKIRELLENGNRILKLNNIEEYMLKTRLLLAHFIDKNKEYLMFHDDDSVDIEKEEKFFYGIEKLKNGFPIQYIIHKQEFMGLDFFVDENVLIPQPDTEVLVQEIMEKVKYGDRILDLCTGSGAIGLAISVLNKNLNLDVCLSDISEKALEIAKRNTERNDVKVKIIKSDLFENIDGVFDIIVSNPPYIETNVIDVLSREVKNEPHIALDGGDDGLDFYRKISKNAKKYLNQNGILGLEIGYNQKDEVIKILHNDGYTDIYSKKDYSGNDRIIICKRGI